MTLCFQCPYVQSIHSYAQTVDVPTCLRIDPQCGAVILHTEVLQSRPAESILKSNYGLFNRNNIHIRSWSWNSHFEQKKNSTIGGKVIISPSPPPGVCNFCSVPTPQKFDESISSHVSKGPMKARAAGASPHRLLSQGVSTSLKPAVRQPTPFRALRRPLMAAFAPSARHGISRPSSPI